MSFSVRDNIRIARDRLTEARRDIEEEIRNYPMPISGCDAQYNHLLGERRRVHEALQILDAEIFVPTSRIPEKLAG